MKIVKVIMKDGTEIAGFLKFLNFDIKCVGITICSDLDLVLIKMLSDVQDIYLYKEDLHLYTYSI